ncbi:MAG: hypothetical protein A2076_06070 [Geobacteraceae bacterium GWC2_53_11]|nr:MAG: hypothetical protein A2076_06070 [Geobacteraceae bacterium GWC2_53_11]
MKTIITTFLITLCLTSAAQADTMQVDIAYSKTQKLLEDKKLSLTGGPNGARDDLAAYSQEALIFYGEAVGNPDHKSEAQRAMMAKRGAVVTAQRSIVEYLEGFLVVGVTLVKDAMVQDDIILSTVTGFIKGSEVVANEYNRDTDTAIAVIKLGLHGPKGYASSFYEKMSSDPKFKEMVKTDKKPFKAEAVKLDEAYDGLIIDATSQNFRPALINRIFAAKGDILYDPAKISQKVLVEQGCGEYTNSIDKAKAALGTRGVKNPLVIKASGAMTAADLQVTDDDAVMIYSANQKGGFMAAAKVAFVLK